MQISKIFRSKAFKQYVNIVSFLLAFAVIAGALSLTVFSRKKEAKYATTYSYAYSYTSDRKNSIQIVGVGNSDLYSAFVPTELWGQQGYTSSLLSGPKMDTIKANTMLESFLKVQSPELLIVEVDMVYGGNAPEKEEVEESFVREKLNTLFERLQPDRFEGFVNNNLSLFNYHDRWKYFGEENVGNEISTPSSHGYKYNPDKVKVTDADLDYMKYSDGVEDIPEDKRLALDKTLEIAAEHNMQVMLLEVPSLTSWSYERHNGMQKYADEHGIVFVDLNVPRDDYKIDYNSDFRDATGNHLNYFGALKATEIIGQEIAKNYDLKDLSNDSNYEDWNVYYSSFQQEITGAVSTNED